MADSGNSWRQGENDEDEEEEEVDETGYKSVKDAVLFAIDVSSSMLAEPPQSDSKKADRDTPTSAALKCAYALMQQRIISNPRDMMGILLFGTEQSKFQEAEYGSGESQYPHCYLLADLDIPAASDIKHLRSIIEDEDESRKLLIPSTKPVAMANVLFCANQIFTTKAPNFSSRRLFLVTDNDNPHALNRDLKSSAIVRAKDLYDLGVIIELFPISRPDHDFDSSKFYDDIVYRGNLTDPEAPAPVAKATKPSEQGDGISLLNSLLNSINSKSVARRAHFSNRTLEFSPNLKISVKGFIIFKKQAPARSCYIWLEGETPQLATGKTTIMADDTARTVERGELRKAFKFGGEMVTFTPEELASIKHFGDPVIRILGFKPISMLPLWASTRPSTFIYPSEEDYIGSTRVFAALHQSLVAKEKMAIVYYIARKNAVPVLAALLPGKERLGDHGEQLMPPGLWISPLPYADDVRDNPEMTTSIHAPDILVDKMRVIHQQLQLPKAIYDPSRYPNPALQWHYRILQAMALEEDIPQHPDDKTVPKYRQIDKRAGEYVIDWGVALEDEYRRWQRKHGDSGNGSHAGEKRAAPKSSSSSASKRVQADVGKDDIPTDADMKRFSKAGTISKLTIPKLKAWLQEKGESGMSLLKKQDLVGMVEKYFDSKMDLD